MPQDIQLLSHQYKVLASRKREIFLGGGVGAGKTMIGSLWAILKARRTPKDVYGLVVSNTYPQLYDTTIRALYEIADKAGVKMLPAQIPRGRGPTDLLVQTATGQTRILIRSLEHYERLSGLEVGWFWADEVWQTRKEAIDVLNARLRDKRMGRLQSLYTSTLDDPSTWMYQRFVEQVNPKRTDVFYAKTADNPNLPKDYIETLKSTYSESMYRRMVLSEWVALDQNRIYTSFARENNVSTEVHYEEALPLLWSHDFNIGVGKPMSSCVLQYHPKTDEYHVIDEIILDKSDTHDAVTEFLSRYPSSGVVIYGDASGQARDTRSRLTDFEILRRAGFTEQKVPRSNPPVRERHNLINALLKSANGKVRIKISPKCRTLIKGLDTVHLKKGANYVEDDSQREQHVTTALGYCLFEELGSRKGQMSQIRVKGI